MLLLRSPESKLIVVELSGKARSGKGTVCAGLAEAFPSSASDETGADYRAATWGLIHEGRLDPEMTKEQVGNVVSTLDRLEIVDYVARRYEIVAEHSKDALHTPEVDTLVKYVSPFDLVRSAVKGGFARRVKVHVDDPNTRMLFVDGRKLEPVIKKVKHAEYLVGLFVDCQPSEAVRREYLRSGLELSGDEKDAWYRETLASIVSRNNEDQNRKKDPARKDKDALNYWFDPDIQGETVEYWKELYGISYVEALEMFTPLAGKGTFREGGRFGAGAKAFTEGKQIYFDTSEIDKTRMVEFAQRIVTEALLARKGRYHAYSDTLLEAA